MARISDFTFPSCDGKTRIHVREWLPDTDHITGVVQIVHGMGEHIGRYNDLAEFLTQYGYVVIGDDHLGHGASVGAGGTKGFFAEKDGWMTAVNDIRTLKIMTARMFPDMPYFMLGHSMGSFMARTYLIRFPRTLTGAVICGTAWVDKRTRANGRRIAAIEIKRVGARGYSPIADRLSTGSYNKAFAPNVTKNDWLSADSANIERYESDPLCGIPSTVGMFRDMLDGLDFNQNTDNIALMDKNTPLYLIGGANDPVGNMGAGVKTTAEKFASAGIHDVKIKLYAGARHEIFNDFCRKDVCYDTLNWLEIHRRAGAPAIK